MSTEIRVMWTELRICDNAPETFYMIADCDHGKISLAERAKWEERRYSREPSAMHLSLIEYAIESANHLIDAKGSHDTQDCPYYVKVPVGLPVVANRLLEISVRHLAEDESPCAVRTDEPSQSTLAA
jgi:hypothetical protein